MTLPKGKTTPTRRQNHERENENPNRGIEEADHWGRGRNEQHRPQPGGKGRRRVLRHRTLREHRPPQRVQHLVGLGRRRARVEVPEGRFHFRSGQRKMRAGYPNSDLRRHGNPAGADSAASQGGRQERLHQGLRSSHPHRRQGPHPADPAQPGQHHGKPREPSGRSPKPRPLPHEPVLPHG